MLIFIVFKECYIFNYSTILELIKFVLFSTTPPQNYQQVSNFPIRSITLAFYLRPQQKQRKPIFPFNFWLFRFFLSWVSMLAAFHRPLLNSFVRATTSVTAAKSINFPQSSNVGSVENKPTKVYSLSEKQPSIVERIKQVNGSIS